MTTLYVIILLCFQVVLTRCDYVFEVRAHSYTNTQHKELNGYCCDSQVRYFTRDNCVEECDNRFTFCLRMSEAAQDFNTTNCPLGSYSTGVIGNDNFNFGSTSIAVGVPNPMVFTGSQWQGSFQLFIAVVDVDPTLTDFIDDLFVDMSLSSSSSFTSAQFYDGLVGNSRVELSFRVQCTSDYYGPVCVTYCVPTDNSNGHYTCGSEGQKICLSSWTDPSNNCLTQNIDDCANVVCQNGGTCIDVENSFQCDCLSGYNGTNCELNIDDCASVVCQNSGTCVDGDNSFQCDCLSGYNGTNCELNIDDCASVVCQNNGTCVDGDNSFQCDCLSGYNGKNCEFSIDDCASVVCQNDGTCIDGVNGFQCNCLSGYNGLNCEVDIDACAGVVCQNGGTCVNMNEGFQCLCVDGSISQTSCLAGNSSVADNLDQIQVSHVIGGVFVGATIFVLLLILIIVVIVCTRRRKSATHLLSRSSPVSTQAVNNLIYSNDYTI